MMAGSHRSLFLLGVLFTVTFLTVTVSSAEVKASSPNATTNAPSATKEVSSTGAPVAVKISITNPLKPADKKADAGNKEDEECKDDEPVAEPEKVSINAAIKDRQGKELNLGDEKDKYTHENATAAAEPEPVGAKGTNDKLTGSNATTTAAPATGAASATHLSTCGMVLGMTLMHLQASFVL